MIVGVSIGIIIVLGIAYVIMLYLDKKQLKKLQEEYKENDDKSRQGKINGFGKDEPSFTRNAKPKEQRVLPLPKIDSNRETDSGVGEADGFDKFFQGIRESK